MFEQLTKFIAGYKLYHRTLDELNALSDRDLRDLSITRGDIPRIAREAVWGDQRGAVATTGTSALRNRRAFA